MITWLATASIVADRDLNKTFREMGMGPANLNILYFLLFSFVDFWAKAAKDLNCFNAM